jgi:serine O-acetyltransferase
MPERMERCRDYQHGTLRGVRRNVAADIDRFVQSDPLAARYPAGIKRRLSALLRPELLSLLAYRLSHCLYVKGWRRSAWFLCRTNFYLHKANIPPHSCIGPGCRLPHPLGVVFHGAAGARLTVFSMAICGPGEGVLDRAEIAAPYLGDDVQLGAQAVVLGPITVGDRARIAHSVKVMVDVPPDVLVASRNMLPASRRLRPRTMVGPPPEAAEASR